MKIVNIRIGLGLFSTLALCCSADANESGLDFALALGHQEVPLLQDGQAVDLRYDSAAIRVAEINSFPLRLDITAGALAASQHPDLSNSAIEFNGQFFGLTLGTTLGIVGPVVGGISMGYFYHTTEGTNATGKLEVNWRQTESRVTLGYNFHHKAILYGCARRLNLNGEELIQTQTTQTLELSERERNGTCLGLQLETGDGGYVKIEALARNSDGIYLSFGRRFRD